MICVVLTRPSPEAMIAAAHEAAAAGAGMVELRLDALPDPVDPGPLVAALPLPAIATCRRPEDGGRSRRPEGERLALLRAAGEAGARWVDVELDASPKLGGIGGARRIVSHHAFDRTPADLPSLRRRLGDAGADRVKLVAAAGGLGDALAILACIPLPGPEAICFALGEAFTFTRIAARRLGSPFTYAALSEGDRAAPGMPTAAELRQVYGWGAIDGDTEVVGLPGPADPPRLAALNRPLREGRGVRLYLPLGVGAAQARAHEGELRALGITLDA